MGNINGMRNEGKKKKVGETKYPWVEGDEVHCVDMLLECGNVAGLARVTADNLGRESLSLTVAA